MIATAATSPLTQAVGQIRCQHVAAVNAGDAEASTNLFASDAILLPPGQPAVEGTTEIRGWFESIFASFRVHDFNLQCAGLDSRGDLAIEHGSWSATFVAKDGGSSLRGRGTYLTIYGRLANGSVRMIRDSFNGLPGRG
jgi:ketosteroid isomerase-like protein